MTQKSPVGPPSSSEQVNLAFKDFRHSFVSSCGKETIVCSMRIVPVQGMCLGAQAGTSLCCLRVLLIKVQCGFAVFACEGSRSPVLELL